MTDPKVTYESLQQDPTFLRAAYHSLRELGENPSEDPKDIIDTFLTKRRYFDVNVLSTYNQGSDIEKLSDDNITNYSYALDQIKKMITLILKGERESASSIDKTLLDINKILFIVSNPIPVKYAVKQLGYKVGEPRLPLIKLDDVSASKVDKVVSNLSIDLGPRFK